MSKENLELLELDLVPMEVTLEPLEIGELQPLEVGELKPLQVELKELTLW